MSWLIALEVFLFTLYGFLKNIPDYRSSLVLAMFGVVLISIFSNLLAISAVGDWRYAGTNPSNRGVAEVG